MKIKLTALAAATLAAIAVDANAGWFGEGGAKTSPNLLPGLWNQRDNYPYKPQLNGKYWRVGWEDELTPHFAARLWYADLGGYHTDALATRDEDHLIPNSNGMCSRPGGPRECPPPELYQTAGAVRALGISGVARSAHLFIEGGLFLSEQKFSLMSVGIYPNPELGDGGVYAYQEKKIARGYMFGGGAEVGGFTLGAYVYDHHLSSWFGNGQYPSGVSLTYALAVGYRFR